MGGPKKYPSLYPRYCPRTPDIYRIYPSYPGYLPNISLVPRIFTEYCPRTPDIYRILPSYPGYLPNIVLVPRIFSQLFSDAFGVYTPDFIYLFAHPGFYLFICTPRILFIYLHIPDFIYLFAHPGFYLFICTPRILFIYLHTPDILTALLRRLWGVHDEARGNGPPLAVPAAVPSLSRYV